MRKLALLSAIAAVAVGLAARRPRAEPTGAH